MILKYRLNIYSEYFQKIEHNLLGQPGAKIKDIKKFESKFKLCEGIKKKFFSNHQYQKLKKVTPYDKLAIDLFFHNIKYFNN